MRDNIRIVWRETDIMKNFNELTNFEGALVGLTAASLFGIFLVLFSSL
jgi:hypothetical protein